MSLSADGPEERAKAYTFGEKFQSLKFGILCPYRAAAGAEKSKNRLEDMVGFDVSRIMSDIAKTEREQKFESLVDHAQNVWIREGS